MTSDTVRESNGLRRVLRFLLGSTLALLFTAGITALMLVLSGWFEPKVTGDPKVGAFDARRVPADAVLGTVTQIRRPRRESAVGTIRAVHEAVVASKILARVEEVRVKAGQEVKQGDVLVVLDKADLKSRIEQGLSAETAAKAKFDQAELELARAERLRARESITQSELDQASTAMKSSRAELERARQSVEEARIIEAYATIRAPMSGRVIDKKVNAGDTVTPGQMLLTMYDPSRMQMIATVRESLAMELKVGQSVPARLDSLGYDCAATVSEIVPEAQAESRSFQVKVTGECPPNVYSGMFGRIFIPLEDEEVLVVPPAAIRKVGQLDEVDVVAHDDIIQRRSIQVGRKLEQGVEVLSGLKAGERVVLSKGTVDRSKGGR
ncbi:MAG: efflux RND transporter periplasmic adaptor subunit [Isosphaeraceae bacterium]|nr:efflux RND transporter periplasmic adaptor subunit [Isosphaeraceae bacterium]